MSNSSCEVLIGDRARIPNEVLEFSKRFIEMPDLDHWLDPTTVPAFPFNKTYDDIFDEVFLILHTTGSTGLPKPIATTHGFWAAIECLRSLECLPGRKTPIQILPGRAILLAFPLFHVCHLTETLPSHC